MIRLAHKRRPLPAHIVVVAFPAADGKSAAGSILSVSENNFFVIEADSEDIVLPHRDLDWLTLSPATALATGLSRVDYRAKDNTRLTRHVEVPVLVRRKSYVVKFSQQPGELVQTQLGRTLNCPLNLDCLVAITLIASLIKKIPIPPAKLIVMIVAILAIVALSFIVSTVRHGFVNVPEPKPLSTDTNGISITVMPGVAIPHGLPLADVAAEDQTIALQTIKEIYWLVKQTM